MIRVTVALLATVLFVGSARAHRPPKPGRSDASAQATMPEHLQLARAVVQASGDEKNSTQVVATVEPLVAAQITRNLSQGDDGDAEKVNALTHETLRPIAQKLAESTIRAYAVNFSSKELSDILAFVTSPTGRDFAAKLPLLKGELAAAMGWTKTGGIPSASVTSTKIAPQTRALIDRLLRSQDFEARTRRGFEALRANWARMGQASGLPPSKPVSDADKKAASDSYWALVVGVEYRFYAANFNDEQLSKIVAYLESDSGQAALARVGLIRNAVSKELQAQLATDLPQLSQRACESTRCTAEQRAALDVDFAKMQQVIAQISIP